MLPATMRAVGAAAALMLTGCAGSPDPVAVQEPHRHCFAAEAVNELQSGVQFNNDCEACVAVAFEYQSSDSAASQRNACYVPARTRVLFRNAVDYRVTTYQDCAEVQESGGVAGLSPAALIQNYKTKRCEIIGEYDD